MNIFINMKIAQVICVYPPYKGGMGNVARDFAHLAHELGKQSTVITSGKNRDYRTADDKGINIKKLRPFLRYGNGAFLPQLFFGLRNYDIVHLHYPFFGVAEIVFFAKFILRQRFKLLIHYHMDTPDLSGIAKVLSVFSRVIAKKLFAIADAITYASDDYIEESAISAYYSKHKEKFFLLPFGVDSDKFIPAGNSAVKKKNILFVGGLDKAHYFKGVDNLIKALKGVLRADLNLIIVGKGDLLDCYKEIAKDMGIDAYVNFACNASDEDLVKYYQNSSLLVLPSINGHEAFGVVLLEAMSAGVPVVASNLPGVRSVFTNGREGLLADPGDTADLRDKIIRLISDEVLRKQMGERARVLVLEKYSFKTLAMRLNTIYR